MTDTNWIIGTISGRITRMMICSRLAPSIFAASMVSLGKVASPERKISTLIPKCDQIATEITDRNAVCWSPIQSTPSKPSAPSSQLKTPSNLRMMLNIVPTITELSTTGKK